jgi:predicted dehydrogenase
MKINWGILSTANIGMQKVIPAIQNAANCEVIAIASRNLDRAKKAAQTLGIPKAYGSYEALMADSEIDAIYIPLPNHLHVKWTIKAMKAGKHVLCEKPIGLNTTEALLLNEEFGKHPELKVMEAFMYRFHPQWKKAKAMVNEGILGEVKTIQSFFSYFNNDPGNIRNQSEIGGGALMDIGSYCISFPRFLFEKEPQRVVGLSDHDPQMKTDRLTSGMLDFGSGQTSTFTCSTQLMPFQRVQIVGTKGRIEIEIPVNTPPDQAVNMTLFTNEEQTNISFNAIDQYQNEAEAFAQSIIENKPVPTPLSDALGNMRVIDSLIESAQKNNWNDCSS